MKKPFKPHLSRRLKLGTVAHFKVSLQRDIKRLKSEMSIKQVELKMTEYYGGLSSENICHKTKEKSFWVLNVISFCP